jgi:hypothetical protein
MVSQVNQGKEKMKKKRLFKENNSSLVEVFPNYNFDEVVLEIESYIKSFTY